MYRSKISESELWAVTKDGEVLWSRGGSSTSPRLMVYPSEKQAEKALNNSWTKQIIPDASMVEIIKIYSNNPKEKSDESN